MAWAGLEMDPIGITGWDSEIGRICERALAGPGLDGTLRARVLARSAQVLVYRGEYGRADEVSRTALDSAELTGDPAALVDALRACQLARSGPDGSGERAVIAARMLDAGRVTGSAWVEMWRRLWRIDTLFEPGQLPKTGQVPGVAEARAGYQDVDMTGEFLPAGDSPGPGAEPELRASHADRDRVVEILRVAAGDGLLTAAELDERLEAALSARTRSELAALTADLPPSGIQPQAKDLVRIDQRFGDVTRTGRWVVPRRMEIRLTAGNVKLDFTEAVITQDTLHIDVDLGIGGDLTLVIRPGIVVDTDSLTATLGEAKIRQVTDPHTPVILRVELAGRVRGGGVVARLPRRTFWQWLLRKPRFGGESP